MWKLAFLTRKGGAYVWALLALVLVGCEKIQPKPEQAITKTEHSVTPEQVSNHQLSRALYSAYLQLDPQFVKVAADAAPVRDLFRGLMMFDPQGRVIPALATSWFSRDDQNWLFTLDEQARWSNGERVTAMDVVASWQRLANPENGSPLASYLLYLDLAQAPAVISGQKSASALGVKAVNAHTLKIELARANSRLPDMLAHVALLPTYQGKKPTPDNLISNGDYQLELASKKALLLKASQATLPFQQVRYQLITSDQNPYEFDVVENPLVKFSQNQTAFPRLCTYFYEFNFADPRFKQKEIRQAIRAMISPVEISRGRGLANYFALPRTFLQGKEHQLPSRTSEQIFHQLGIDATNPMQIVLTYDQQGQHSEIAQQIGRILSQSDLFRVKLQGVEWQTLLQKRAEKDFQFIRSGWCADYADPVVFLMPFHSASPDNKSGYMNEKVDKWLEALQQPALSATQREQFIREIVSQLEADVAILPLFQYQRKMAFAPSLKGYDLNNASEVIYSKDLSRQLLKE